MVRNQIWKVVVGTQRDAASKERSEVFLTSWGQFRFHQPMLERHLKEKKNDPLLPNEKEERSRKTFNIFLEAKMAYNSKQEITT